MHIHADTGAYPACNNHTDESKSTVQVHAEGEAEHAAIGHSAVAGFVPACHIDIVRQAMKDHDRDFSAFYTALAKMLEA